MRRPSLRSLWHLRGLNRNVRLYLVSMAFRSASLSLHLLLLNLYLASLGFDAVFMGLVNTLFYAASLICSLPAGMVADRIGRKRAMVIGLVGMTLSRLGVALFSQGALIAAANALFGVIGPLFYTSISPFLAENSTRENRALAFSLDASVKNFSSFAMMAAGGYLPTLFATLLKVGPESAPAYRGAMFVSAGVMGLGLLPILAIRGGWQPRTPRAARAKLRLLDQFPEGRLLFRLLAPRVALALGAGLLFPFFNVFFKQRFGVTDAALGWILGVTDVLVGFMILGGGIAAERLGEIRALLIARMISTPLLLVIGFVPWLPAAVLAHWIRSGLMRLGGPLYMAFAMERLDEHNRATGSSLLGMTWDLGYTIGPYVSGIVQVRYGFSPLFLATGALYALSLVLVYRFFGGRRRVPLPAGAVKGAADRASAPQE